MELFGRQSAIYVKDIYNEHWDDYQLKSVQLGANKELFDLQKEYNIAELPFKKRYTHAAIKWYMQMHKARLDGTMGSFKLSKPTKNIQEKLQRAKTSVNNAKEKSAPTFAKIAKGFSVAGGAVKSGAVKVA